MVIRKRKVSPPNWNHAVQTVTFLSSSTLELHGIKPGLGQFLWQENPDWGIFIAKCKDLLKNNKKTTPPFSYRFCSLWICLFFLFLIHQPRTLTVVEKQTERYIQKSNGTKIENALKEHTQSRPWVYIGVITVCLRRAVTLAVHCLAECRKLQSSGLTTLMLL